MTAKFSTKSLQIACANCSLAQLCLPVGLTQAEINELDTLINSRFVLNPGEFLFKEGDTFTNLFAVRAGSFKAFRLSKDGEQTILNFYMPGEILGFHAIHEQKFHLSAVALETSSVCVIPFANLSNLTQKIPSLQKHIINLMSQKIDSDLTNYLNAPAQARVARFLLSISQRLHRRGLSGTEFNLSMSREDIGNFLGLATETISRIFSQMQKQQILASERRSIKILDMAKLHQLTYGETG